MRAYASLDLRMYLTRHDSSLREETIVAKRAVEDNSVE